MEDKSINTIEVKIEIYNETIIMKLNNAVHIDDVVDFMERVLKAKKHLTGTNERLVVTGN